LLAAENALLPDCRLDIEPLDKINQVPIEYILLESDLM
jgi:hypothetical protein